MNQTNEIDFSIEYEYLEELSECCAAPITELGEFCSSCKEHC